MSPEVMGALVGGVAAALGALAMWVGVTNRLAAMEARFGTKLDDLASQVAKHNQVVERTYRLEERMTTIFRLHDELKDEVDACRHVGGTD